jgi:hypothetical protein
MSSFVPRALRSAHLRRRTSTFLCALGCALAGAFFAACGGDEGEDSKTLSELNDAEFIASCNATRTELGADALIGGAHYTCLAASTIGGSCNMNVFENCVSVAVPPCTAPAPTSPLRTCSATVDEQRACALAVGAQYSAYRNTNCTTPPTSTPKKESEVAACAALCTKCPSACT